MVKRTKYEIINEAQRRITGLEPENGKTYKVIDLIMDKNTDMFELPDNAEPISVIHGAYPIIKCLIPKPDD